MKITLASPTLACENSRPSSLPGPSGVSRNATRAGSEERRLFSQATSTSDSVGLGRWAHPGQRAVYREIEA